MPSTPARGTRLWTSFLSGYTGVRSLGANEVAATAAFVALRHIWLIGLQTQLATMAGFRHGDGYFDEHLGIIRRWLDGHKVL